MARRVATSEPLDELIKRLVAAAAIPAGSSESSDATAGAPGAAAVAVIAPSSGAPPDAPTMDLSAPLREAVRVSRAAAATAADDPRLVANTESGVVHRVAVGPGVGPAALWAAACGWHYGSCPHADVNPVAGLPSDYRLVCQKCLPLLRRARFDALAAVASAG